jgi:transposase InsO family protein
MAWKTVDVKEQRVRFVVRAIQGKSYFQDLCDELGISRPTGYEWLRRYQVGGIEAIVEKSRGPQRSPQRTAPEIEQRVVELRQHYPDWGRRKLQRLLQREGVQVPAVTVHRILLRHDLVRRQDRHRTATQRFERSQPNQLWQMDFKGPVGWQAPVGPLSVLDDHSRYGIALKGTWTARAKAVQEALLEAFERCGLPEAMWMDHGTPWWNMKAATGATWLTVWLMKQDIQLHFSGYRHPQTQGKVERFHGSLARATQLRGFPTKKERQIRLDEYVYEYNYVRPHEALGMKTPAEVWRKSNHQYEAHRPAWEYESEAEVRKIVGAGHLSVDGRHWEISRALAGEWVKLERIAHRVQVYYCRSLVRELDLTHQRSTAVDRWWD